MGDPNERRNRTTGPAPGRRVPARNSASDSEFINLELDKAQTIQYRQWREDPGVIFNSLDKEINSGYRFTLKYDDYNSGYACFMFPPEGHDNSGYILTGRGGSAFRAIAECLYKHGVVLVGEWSRAADSQLRSVDPDW